MDNGNGGCVDINECLYPNACDANAKCMNIDGGHQCICDNGFTMTNGSCIDDNECTSNPCSSEATCRNTDGSFSCECPDGKYGDGLEGCYMIDACITPGRACDVNALCHTSVIGAVCTCKPGFSGNGYECTDNNECTNGSSICDPLATCTNTYGSYEVRF